MLNSSSAQPEAGMTSPSGRSLRGSHQMAAFSVCERLAELRYLRGYVPKVEKEDRLRGTLVHLCMAYYYAARLPPDQRPAWFTEVDLRTALERKGRGFPDAIVKSLEVMSAFDAEYGESLPRWDPVSIEAEYVAPVREIDPALEDDITKLKSQYSSTDLVNREALEQQIDHLERMRAVDDDLASCRPDLIASIKTTYGPELWVVDYKTQSPAFGRSKGLRTWYQDAEYFLDWQVLVNLTITRAPSNQARLGHRFVKGFVIQRATRKPDDRGRYHFDRHILTIPKVAYARTPRRIRAALMQEREVRRKVAAGIETLQNYWACYGRYGACDYRPLCGASTIEDAYKTLNEEYRRGDSGEEEE